MSRVDCRVKRELNGRSHCQVAIMGRLNLGQSRAAARWRSVRRDRDRQSLAALRQLPSPGLPPVACRAKQHTPPVRQGARRSRRAIAGVASADRFAVGLSPAGVSGGDIGCWADRHGRPGSALDARRRPAPEHRLACDHVAWLLSPCIPSRNAIRSRLMRRSRRRAACAGCRL
jgi:hypothetical protein